MSASTVLAGFGGQGLLFAGHVLAQAALEEGSEVSWLPSYGPEMRGGTASCTVIVADRPIGAPIVDEIDVLVALNPPSLAKFEPAVRPGSLVVLNSSLIEAQPRRDDAEFVRVPASELAREAGDARMAGVVALGAALARRRLVSMAACVQAIRVVAAKAGPETVAANERALLAGFLAGASSPA
jgi:2-oxoglutarate ferredoxin oxidoreductase subunit gamma